LSVKWRHDGFSADLSLRISKYFQPVGIADQTIEDGVSHGGVRDAGVPDGDGELGGHQRGASSIAFIKDIERPAL
jgi:hypothetical protein